MDRSKAETTNHPLGDTELLKESLDLIKAIQKATTLAEQIELLRKVIVCADKWCPVSTWGIKKIDERTEELIRSGFFAPDIRVVMNYFGNVRVASLLVPTRVGADRLYVDRKIPKNHQEKWERVGTFLFVTENCSLITIDANSHITGESVLPAHEMSVFSTTNVFLIGVINHPNGGATNRTLITDAMESLCQTLYWARKRAQDRVDQLGNGHNAMSIIHQEIKTSWSKQQ